jgi:glycosyltransferase involved in cell wall biosynthesis
VQKDVIVSVVIPCFNHGLYLWEAIRSVEQAGYPHYEIIVVDDGSTDELTRKVAQEVKDAGYQIILQENKGVAASRNTAIALAKGKYIIPLDADNRLLKPYFFEGVKILDQYPQVGVVYGDALIIGEKSGDWKNHPLKLEEILFENYIDTCAIIRKSMWEDVGGYDVNAPVPTRQDYIFWLDCIGKDWKFKYLPSYCFEYRFLDNSEVRKYSRISSKRRIITEYLFERQKHLIQRELERKNLSKPHATKMLSRLRSQLAVYHFQSGSIWQAYGFLIRAFAFPQDFVRLFKIAVGGPIKRILTQS